MKLPSIRARFGKGRPVSIAATERAMRLGVLLLAGFCLASVASAKPGPARIFTEGQSPQPPVTRNGLPYLLFLPKGYNNSGSERWPLLIFLHGSGERGSDLNRVKANGPPKLVEADPAFPFIVISPQLPAAADPDDPWSVGPLDAILRHVLKTLRVDPNRVYLTGLSLGGMATWAWASTEPQLFAAIVPVSATADPRTACALKSMPTWDFHGDRDDTLDPKGDFEMVEAVRSCGGHPRLTIYPDTGHDAWDQAYSDPALWMWLLEQRRNTNDSH